MSRREGIQNRITYPGLLLGLDLGLDSLLLPQVPALNEELSPLRFALDEGGHLRGLPGGAPRASQTRRDLEHVQSAYILNNSNYKNSVCSILDSISFSTVGKV